MRRSLPANTTSRGNPTNPGDIHAESSSATLALALAAGSGDARADNGVTPVTVQNPVTLNPTTPNPVTVVNPQSSVNLGNTADLAAAIAKAMGVQHPTQFGLNSHSGLFAAGYVVPSNQRLIIESVSGQCGLDA